MTTNRISWKQFCALTKHFVKGEIFETNLLGKALPVERNRELVGYIPEDLARSAKAYGFTILEANWKSGTYVVRKDRM